MLNLTGIIHLFEYIATRFAAVLVCHCGKNIVIQNTMPISAHRSFLLGCFNQAATLKKVFYIWMSFHYGLCLEIVLRFTHSERKGITRMP